MALVFRLSLLAAIWHAPLPTIDWHAEADDHDAVAFDDDSSDRSKLEINFIFPCQLNGCEHSSPLHGDDSEHDHSTHIASVGYGLLGDADVDLIDSSMVDQHLGAQSAVATMAACQSSANCASLFKAAQHTAATAVPSLPLRANLQVFRI